MSNTDELRWRQRLDNFRHALSQLDDACRQASYTPLERAGLAQTFMFTFELSWKVLKDILFYEGYDLDSPRRVIRQSFASQYISENDCEAFLEALDKRNLLGHIYREELAREAETLIKSRYHPMLERLRATLEQKEDT